jgi:hypothetical protein
VCCFASADCENPRFSQIARWTRRGHFYFTKYALDCVKQIKAIAVEAVGGSGGIILDKVSFSMIDEKAKSLC